MAKRIAGSELNDRNWDDEDEPEEAGLFIQAPKDVIEQRAIKKAKRRVAGDNSGSKAAFSGFGGFGLKAPAPTTDAFSGFKKLDSASAPSKAGIFGGTSSVNGGENQKSKGSGDSKESSTYLSSLRSLNESVLAWIKQHVESNPFIILTPIFKDYEKYLQMIQGEKSPASDTSLAKGDGEDSQGTALTAGLSTKVTSFAHSTTASKPDDDKEKSAAASSGKLFTFGQTSATTPALGGFSFATSTGSTGNAVKFTAPNSTSVTGFSFSQKGSESSSLLGKPSLSSFGSANSSQGLFSFGKATTSQGSTGGESSQETREKDDEEYEPPKPEVKEIVESDALYSKRCKLYYQKDGQWVDRGVGNLHLKPVADNKTQLLIRADTNLGNILLNVMLSSTMPVSRQGKNNVLVVCVPNPAINTGEAEGTPIPMLIRVKTEEDADELLAKVDERKKLL
ncbi:unnamed protein product [Candidula unifasciata]|uniref:RanBD1 domain-containing protein n=1 Tax=Candidula unifasciata TaxID=100452 RepID=A0A8S3YLG0_9EUPU|nr:unnamed protein product [Candidula unifasciata]